MALVVRNPATGKALAELPEATRGEVQDAVARARAAQPGWAGSSVAERAAVMDKFRGLLLDDRAGMAETITRETGKPLAEALGIDVLCTLDAARWLASEGARVLAPERLRLANPLFTGRFSLLERAPKGVVGIVSPWNYPLAIPASNALHALFAGNTVVLKPASLTPLTALRFRDLAHRAGVPADAFQVVVGSGKEAGQALVDAPVDHLVFTGSVPIGKEVEARLRARGVSSTLELGGMDPAVVLADAPWPDAVRGVLWGRFTNCGQTCAATKRVFVHRSLHDRFVEELTRQVQALRLGDPTDPATEVGPLTDPRSVADMEAFVADAVTKGATLRCGGSARPDLGPQFFEPTLLTGVPEDARVLTEEVFGPVLPVVSFDEEEQAVQRANATPFGLSASVWTADTERGLALARRIHAGTVVLNDVAYTYAAHEVPWGGLKDSGHGWTHGRWGLEELTTLRHLHVVPPKPIMGRPWWFPYGPGLQEFLERGVQWLYGGAAAKARTTPGMLGSLVGRRKGP